MYMLKNDLYLDTIVFLWWNVFFAVLAFSGGEKNKYHDKSHKKNQDDAAGNSENIENIGPFFRVIVKTERHDPPFDGQPGFSPVSLS